MNEEILALINAKNPDDEPYNGFTILAQNSDGVRMIMHNVSEFDLMMQTMILIRECKMDEGTKGDKDVRH